MTAAQQAFVQALRDEYIHGNREAVGDYFQHWGDNPSLEKMEDTVRSAAPNRRAAVIDEIGAKLQGRPIAGRVVSSSDSDDSGGDGAYGPISAQPAYIRRDFVRKVYSILSVQLILTVMIVFPFVTYLKKEWLMTHMSVYYIATFGSLGLMLGMTCCCQQAARTFPTNYLLLLAITVLMSITVGCVSTLYTIASVLQALAATALVFIGLTAFACFTKTDFTGCWPYLFAFAMAMMAFGLVMSIWSMFAPVPHMMQMIYALCGVILFSFYIVFDTQMVVGGNHQLSFEVDDYAFAALQLYLDIINMFLYLLQLFGDRD